MIAHAPPMLHLMPGDEQQTPAPLHIMWYGRHAIHAVQDKGEDAEVPADDAEDAAQPGRPVGMLLLVRIHPCVQQAHQL